MADKYRLPKPDHFAAVYKMADGTTITVTAPMISDESVWTIDEDKVQLLKEVGIEPVPVH